MDNFFKADSIRFIPVPQQVTDSITSIIEQNKAIIELNRRIIDFYLPHNGW